jgi:hypothetical protein
MIFLSVVVVSLLRGRFGQPGPDGDDVMRLVQVRDLLAGQGWFDLHQYRLGPDGGTLMHWSRIPDIPIIVLTGLFDLFLPQDMALAWAISVWPPISMLILLGGLLLAVRNIGDGKLLVFTLIVGLFILLGHFRFLAGSIDHHNLQLGFLAVAVGAALDRQAGSRNMVLSAIMLAVSVAVGIELYPFVAVLCAFHAFDWAWRGAEIRNGTVAFGGGLAGQLPSVSLEPYRKRPGAQSIAMPCRSSPFSPWPSAGAASLFVLPSCRGGDGRSVLRALWRSEGRAACCSCSRGRNVWATRSTF